PSVKVGAFLAAALPSCVKSGLSRRTVMIHFVLAILTVCAPALARDNGQYENFSPDVRAWFRSQKSPKTGALCCNEADGLYAEEDIRDGHYWTRWGGREWQPVPDEVVIHQPNPHG